MIRSLTEKLISFTPDGTRTFFDTADFPWVAAVEARAPEIRRELDSLLRSLDRIPNFQDLSPDQATLTDAESWKTFFLHAYGHRAEANCDRCPETERALRQIPGLQSAMFSILAPEKHLPEHRGPHKGVLRYHLALIVPGPPGACRIRVGSDVRAWEEGKSLIFDDSHLHEAWNDSDRHRVVLFVDFERPLPFPLSIINRLVIRRIAGTPFITDLIRNVRAGGIGERASQRVG